MSKAEFFTTMGLQDQFIREGDMVHEALLPTLAYIAHARSRWETVVLQDREETFEIKLGKDITISVDHDIYNCGTCREAVGSIMLTKEREEEAMYEWLRILNPRVHKAITSNP